MLGIIARNRKTIFIFITLVFLVIIVQFILLELALKIGFKPDDWALYFKYKSLGDNPFLKITDVWRERGIYTTYQIYYIGVLERLVGFDYRSFQVTHILFKSLAAITLFPLVLIIFKDRLLAIFTSIFLTFSAASVGPLEFVVKGSDYLATFWMNIFLITYYLIIKKYPRNILLLFSSFLLLSLSLTFSPIRLYPILILILFTEIYLLTKDRSIENLKNVTIRIVTFFLPLVILIVHSPDSITGLLQGPIGIFRRIFEGDWQLILPPFSGLGHSIITTEQWYKLLGILTVNNINEYIYFLLGGPSVLFGALTLTIAFLKFKKTWPFFIYVFSLNLILEILLFFIITHYKYSPISKSLQYDLNETYYVFFGIYFFVLGLGCLFKWLKKKETDNILLALWLSILFSFSFIFATWAFAPYGTGFSGTSYYLVVASEGSSLFIAAFLLSAYRKIVNVKRKLLRIILLFPILLLIISTFWLYGKEIHIRFLDLLANGRSAQGQQVLQGRFKDHIKNIDLTKHNLFYFDTSEIHGDGPFYSEGFLASFPFWMHFQNNKLIDGCLEIFYEGRQKLSSLIETRDGKRGFVYKSLCVENGLSFYRDIFYKPDNFYAFKIKSMEFIDIKKEVLDGFKF